MGLFGPPDIEALKRKGKTDQLVKAIGYRKDPGIQRAAFWAVFDPFSSSNVAKACEGAAALDDRALAIDLLTETEPDTGSSALWGREGLANEMPQRSWTPTATRRRVAQDPNPACRTRTMPSTSTSVRVKVDSDTRSLDVVVAEIEAKGGQVTIVAERPEGRRNSWSMLPGHAWLVVNGLTREQLALSQGAVAKLARRGDHADVTIDDLACEVLLRPDQG